MKEELIKELFSAIITIAVGSGMFGLVSVYGTRFMKASRNLIRRDIVRAYHVYKEKNEIPQWELESLELEYEGYNDMLPREVDKVVEKMMNDIRKMKIIR